MKEFSMNDITGNDHLFVRLSEGNIMFNSWEFSKSHSTNVSLIFNIYQLKQIHQALGEMIKELENK